MDIQHFDQARDDERNNATRAHSSRWPTRWACCCLCWPCSCGVRHEHDHRHERHAQGPAHGPTLQEAFGPHASYAGLSARTAPGSSTRWPGIGCALVLVGIVTALIAGCCDEPTSTWTQATCWRWPARSSDLHRRNPRWVTL